MVNSVWFICFVFSRCYRYTGTFFFFLLSVSFSSHIFFIVLLSYLILLHFKKKLYTSSTSIHLYQARISEFLPICSVHSILILYILSTQQRNATRASTFLLPPQSRQENASLLLCQPTLCETGYYTETSGPECEWTGPSSGHLSLIFPHL